MKRLLISVCVAMALPTLALAQTTATQPPKAAAKKAAPAAKPKVVIMTRDELRTCLKLKAANSTENTAIDEEKAAFQQERNDIMASKDALLKQVAELEASTKAILAERAELVEAQKAFEKPIPKSEMKAAEARRVELNDKIAAHERKVNAYNADKQAFNTNKQVMDARIEANNARGQTLSARAEKYNDSIEDWRANCGNKPYDTDDEAAVKKELGLAK